MKMTEGERKLHKEIVQFASCCERSCVEAEQCVDEVQRIARSVIPNATAHLFGSQAAGLALEDSDIDIVVLSPDIPDCRDEPSSKFTVIKYMGIIAEAIHAVNPGAKIHVEQMISNASVPILKCITVTGRKCDLSFGVQGGLQAAAFMKSEVETTPAIRPTLLILKQLLKEKDLNEVYRGGVSSYGLFHMVLSYFSTFYGNGMLGVKKAKEQPRREMLVGGQFPYFRNTIDGPTARDYNCKDDTCQTGSGKGVSEKEDAEEWGGVCLGRSLLDILEMYGADFDARTLAVHAKRGLIPKSSTRLEVDRRDVGKARLSVVDLMDPTHDVASGSFNTALVLTAFTAARTALLAGLCLFAFAKIGTLCL
jgi:DNA polymerase sigma